MVAAEGRWTLGQGMLGANEWDRWVPAGPGMGGLLAGSFCHTCPELQKHTCGARDFLLSCSLCIPTYGGDSQQTAVG